MRNKLRLGLLIALFLFMGSVGCATASVSEIDDDVKTNMSFPDSALLDYDINITWTATHTGYLYWFFFDAYCGSGTSLTHLTGGPSGRTDVGIASDKSYGMNIRVWRMGYVENGTQYTFGGHIEDPGGEGCGCGEPAAFWANPPSYNGKYTGHIITMTLGGYDECSAAWGEYKALLIESPTHTISGYVTNNLDNAVSSATVELNNSGGSDTTDDYGYYEITGINSGTYSITVTSPTHEDYSDIVSITSDTEKNITLTRLTPVLSNIDKTTTKTDVWIRWTRNIVTDTIYIYKDRSTRLYTIVGGGSYLTGSYIDENLACSKGYVYWLQPMDGDIAGPKYRIDAKTRSCDGGSGGGGGKPREPGEPGEEDPKTDPDPINIPTPGPTPPPGTNLTQEEWLNLTLEQQQQILINLTLLQEQQKQQLTQPLKAWLTIHREDVASWTVWLFIGICATVFIDSITIQKISKYTGILALIPGIYFAYLAGFL